MIASVGEVLVQPGSEALRGMETGTTPRQQLSELRMRRLCAHASQQLHYWVIR